MSKVERLLAKPIKKVIGGEEWEIHPLGVDELELMMNVGDPSKKAESLKEILVKTVQLSDPEATREQILKMPFNFYMEWQDAIEEVNGLKDMEEKIKAKAK